MRQFRRFAAWLITRSFSQLLMLALIVNAPAFAEENTIIVKVFQARIVKIPAGARTLVIGNPIVADVTMQNGVMIVTGKGFGETNFIALDDSGNPVAESIIRVIAGTNNLLVQRGMERQSLSCAPRCEPTVQLGDDAKYFGEVSGQFNSVNAQGASGK